MNFLKLFLLNLCPINMFRLNREQRLPHIFKYSMIDVFNDVLERDPKEYNKKFREIYEIPEDDEVFIFNYRGLELYYNRNLKDKELSYSTINKINKYGCVYRTKVPIYRALTLFVGDGVLEHYYLYHTLMIILVTNFSSLLSSIQLFKNNILQFIFNSLAILVPQLMVMYMLDAKYLTLTVFLCYLAFAINCLFKKPWKNQEKETLKNGFVHYINFTRGTLIVAIVIAILAVDNIHFNQFMRKTHYDGFSAMDIGAGFFICQTGSSISLSKRKKTLWIIFKKNIIILAIGLIRSISVAVLGYGVDEREYGKHWNFFFTLGLTRILVDIINQYLNKRIVYFVPFAITLVYEIILLSTRAIDKLPKLPRSNVIYANREGLLSIPNSISASLASLLITKIALYYYKQGKKFRAYLTYQFTCLLFFFFANVLYFAKLKSSRAMNNMRFLFYVLFLYNLATSMILLFEILYPRYKENAIIDLVGRYPLLSYSLANILTGLVNVTLKPYLYPLVYFIIIMLVYCNLTFLFPFLLKRFKIKPMSQWL